MKPLLLFALTIFLIGQFNAQTLTFSIDYTVSDGSFKKLTSVNNGPTSVNFGTAQACYNQIGVEFVRTHDFHGPFDYNGYSSFYTNGAFNYSFETADPSFYSWSTTDSKMQEITAANLQPFFRLGISFPSQGSTPVTPMPKDADGIQFTTFAGICKRTAMHYTQAWNNGFNYEIPYWEIWNEPNHALSWTVDSVQAYYRMYKQATDSLKSVNPNFKVGGPGTAKNAFYANGNGFTLNHSYISNFFTFCQQNNAPLDFYSFHTYEKKNPYHVKLLADTLAYFLDQKGFTQTELIVSEMNVTAGTYQNTGKGCAYIASSLIAASDTRISKILWYRGVDLGALCGTDDSNGNANLMLNAYAYQFYNELYDSTTTRISSSNNVFNSTNINDSLNNVMLIAGKNATGDLVKILLSNYESSYQQIDLSIASLNWNASDQVEVEVQKVNDAGYTKTSSQVNGGSSITVPITSVSDANTYLITLRRNASTAVSEIKPGKTFAYPNPVSTSLQIESTISVKFVSLADLQGKKVLETNECKNLDVSQLQNGMYLLQIEDQFGNQFSEKIRVQH